jgi:hypothetical protein
MINIEANISDDEVILYEVKKKKRYIPFMLVFCPLWMFIAMIFIVPCFKNMFFGAISFDSNTTYLISIFFMLLLVPFAILTPISYIFNRFVITDQRIYIRKGLSGILHIINHSDILAYQHSNQIVKGSSSHFIYIYLKSGKRIFSGNLYIKNSNIPELIEVMESIIQNTISSRKQYKEYRHQNFETCNNKTKRNRLFPVISLLPFILALIMVILYFTEVNKVGKQFDIQIYGRVESKTIDYDNGEITGYDLIIIEEESYKRYDLPVNEKMYYIYEVGENILIRAKKGTLGIVYDQRVYEQ